jgi:hypothetical protein
MTTEAAKPTAEDWLARAAAVQPRTELFIDGRFEPAASGRTFDDIAGRDGTTIARIAEGDRTLTPGGFGPWPDCVRRRTLVAPKDESHLSVTYPGGG